MRVIVVVYAAFGLTVSEAKTEITREGNVGVHRHIQRRSSGPGVQPEGRVCIPRGKLKIRMLGAEVLETMLYGCVTWSPRACHYDAGRRAHHRVLTCYMGWRKRNRTDHPILYLDTLIKTESESIVATLRRRRLLFAGFVARMEDTRLSKCVIFGELVGGADCVGGQEKTLMERFLHDLRAFGINADQWTTAAQDEGE